MSIDRNTIRRIARLSRLAVDDTHLAAMEAELNAILAWVEQLGEVDVEVVPPMTSAVHARLPMRADAVTDGGYPDALVSNAPATEDHFFVVPTVVE